MDSVLALHPAAQGSEIFFSLLHSLWRVLRSNPSSAKSKGFRICSAAKAQATHYQKCSGCPGCVILEKQMSAEPRLICRYFRSTSKIIFEIFFVRTCIGSNFSQFRDFFCLLWFWFLRNFGRKLGTRGALTFFQPWILPSEADQRWLKDAIYSYQKKKGKLDTWAGTGLGLSP